MATLQVQGNPTIIDMDDPKMSSKNPSIVDDFMYSSNVAGAHMYIRMGFLRKVYGILTAQLLVTMIYAYICFINEPMEMFFKKNPWTLFVIMIISFASLFALHFKSQHTPYNYILLGIFTLSEAALIGVIVTMYDAVVVLEATCLTFAVTLGLTLYTFQSQRDFSKMGGALVMGLMMLIMSSLLVGFFHTPMTDLAISVGGAVLFCGFIIYDTHLLMHRLSPEEYMLAAVNLYLDIINLFLYILRILQAAKK